MLVLAVAGIASSLLFAALVFLIVSASSHHNGRQFGVATTIALYPSTLVSVFFNVALACAASAAFDGEHLSAREALRMAWGKRRRIALWALISVLIGVLINEIASRLPGGGRIVGWLAGAAWGLATIFVIPILAMEGVGAVDAFKRSAGVVKQRWGEGVTGRIAISAWSVIGAVPLVIALVVGGALLKAHPGAGIALIALSLVALFALFAAVAATQQVFAVALYRYAIDAPIGGFASSDLEYPFTADRARQKRKSWILRIGVPILALFALLMVIVAIIGPRKHHTAAEGYFHLDYAATNAPSFRRGAPVIFHRRQIGAIVSTAPAGEFVRVVIKVDPRYRRVVETNDAFVEHLRGLEYLQYGAPSPGTNAPARFN